MIYNINYNENFIEILSEKADNALVILPGKYLTDIFKKRGLNAISYDDLWFEILPSRASHIAESIIIDRVIKGNYTIRNQLRQAINEFFYYGLNIKDLVCVNAQHDLLKETIIELYKLLDESALSLRASTLQSILNSDLNLFFTESVYVVLPVIFSPTLFKILELFREKFGFNLVMYGYDKAIDYEISCHHPQYFIQEFLKTQCQIVDLNYDNVKIHPDNINIALSQMMYPANLLYRLHNEELYQFNHIGQFTSESIAEEFMGIASVIERSDAQNISIVSKDSDKLKLLFSYLKEKMKDSRGNYKISSSTPTYCYDYKELRLFFRILDVFGVYEVTLTEIFDLLKQSNHDQNMICLAEKTLLEVEELDDKDIKYAERILENNQLFDASNLLRKVISFCNTSKVDSDFILPIELSENHFDRLLRAHIIAYMTITGYMLDDRLIELLIEVQSYISSWALSLQEYKNIMFELGMRTVISSEQYCENSNIDDNLITIDLLTSVERRFLSYDLTIICDLKEGIWPPTTDDHFFISEYTRRISGYKRPTEYEIGYAAYDFISILASSKKVIISNLNTSEIFSQDILHKQSIDSRFLSIFNVYTRISDINSDTHYIDGLRSDKVMLSEAVMYIPVEYRPKSLSATSIARFIDNPYLYSLEYNLHLKYLPKSFSKKLELPSNKEFGIILHNILHRISKEITYREDYSQFNSIFQSIAESLIAEKYRYKANYMITFWQVKFDNIIRFIYNYNQELYREHNYDIKTETEKSISIDIKVSDNNIKLQARADRLDWTRDLLYISDYKTGQLPSKSDIESGKKGQLNLEALIIILLSNDFDLINGDLTTLNIQDIKLRYIRLTGIESEIKDIPFNLANTITQIREILNQLYCDVIPYIGNDKYDNYLQGHIMRSFDTIEHKH